MCLYKYMNIYSCLRYIFGIKKFSIRKENVPGVIHMLHVQCINLSQNLTCELTIMLYKSSLGVGVGTARVTSVTLQLLFLCLALVRGGGGAVGASWSSARWSSSRRACEVANRSKNSSFCSDVMEENTTVGKHTAHESCRLIFPTIIIKKRMKAAASPL